jgi:hypothetical protein
METYEYVRDLGKETECHLSFHENNRGRADFKMKEISGLEKSSGDYVFVAIHPEDRLGDCDISEVDTSNVVRPLWEKRR